jgi:hypothetical protein
LDFSISPLCGAMVYITSWDEFVERSVQLFRADPDSVRFFIFSSTFSVIFLFSISCLVSEKARGKDDKVQYSFFDYFFIYWWVYPHN